ncbi:MAG: methionine--tRNA ligase [Vampirovibrionales bacterium]
MSCTFTSPDITLGLPASPVMVTTAIDYVNGTPHIGHAYEKMATDAYARFQRFMERPVRFLTGVDEHGIKVQQSAEKAQQTPQAFCDTIAQAFHQEWQTLGLTFDQFVRTTDPAHHQVVAWMWQTMASQGDLYKASYTGLYCSGCERFLPEKDLTPEGECPIHLRVPAEVSEENWFFRLSAYKERIKHHIEQHPDYIQPDFRREEVLKMLDDLEDISVSRTKGSVHWGIPVPNDPDQVIYVWIDALSNYLTGAGFQSQETLYQTFWQQPSREVTHIIGKDILRFHAIYWTAMLMATNIPLPTRIFAHGFVNLNGHKISKSLGNVIAPRAYIEALQLPHADPLRYYLLAVIPFGQDGNVSEEEFKLRVNADLANNLGNLLNRTLSMTHKYFQGVLPETTALTLTDLPDTWQSLAYAIRTSEVQTQVHQAYTQLQFHQASEAILKCVDGLNQLIQLSEPWQLHKQETTHPQLAWVLTEVLESLRHCAMWLSPITPNLSQAILTQLGLKDTALSYSDLSSLPHTIRGGCAVEKGSPVLPRLDSELAGASKKGAS